MLTYLHLCIVLSKPQWLGMPLALEVQLTWIMWGIVSYFLLHLLVVNITWLNTIKMSWHWPDILGRLITFFITMTVNPNWKEVMDIHLPCQISSDHPDLVAPVFYQKKQALLHDTVQKDVVGHCIAYVCTVEFQKQGLPHMHLLVIVDQTSRCKDAQDLNDFICTEKWILYYMIWSFIIWLMVHVILYAKIIMASALRSSQSHCTRRLPLILVTHQRQPNGFSCDNSHVVPHSRYFLKNYWCEILCPNQVSQVHHKRHALIWGNPELLQNQLWYTRF